VDAFFQWFAQFIVLVHHHHDNEDSLFFPALKKKFEIPAKLTEDHHWLLGVLAFQI